MQRLNFEISIKAPVEHVVKIMLGKETFRLWTAEFEPTSDFEGSWGKGDKIYFTGIDENGKKGGMVSEIAEHIPNKFVSIRHYGILDGDREITEGKDVEKWAGGFENYTYEENDGVTTVFIAIDTTEEHAPYFNLTYPKALEKLKELCEHEKF